VGVQPAELAGTASGTAIAGLDIVPELRFRALMGYMPHRRLTVASAVTNPGSQRRSARPIQADKADSRSISHGTVYPR